MAVAVGGKLDRRYAIRREIARGRTQIIYQAQHLFTLRSAAIKLLYGPSVDDEEQRNALVAEGRLLAELRHPCIVDLVDGGWAGGLQQGSKERPFLVMEMLEGRSLAGVLATRPILDVDSTLRIAQGLCSALSCIHSSGAIHYALAPRNVILPPTGPEQNELWPGVVEPAAKIIDFHVAAQAITSGYVPPRDSGEGRSVHEYLAPEQLAQLATDERSDVFSLGVTLYECLTGRLPYDGLSTSLTASSSVPSPSTVREEVPAPIGEAILQAIAAAPADRYRSAQAFGEALRDAQSEALRRETTVPPPPRPTAPPAARRATPRAAYLTPVRVRRRDGSAVDGSSEDISEGGMLLLGPRELEDKERVAVRFALPMSSTIVTVSAVARWRREARDGRGATGLQFQDLHDEERDEIRKYVDFFGVRPDEQ